MIIDMHTHIWGDNLPEWRLKSASPGWKHLGVSMDQQVEFHLKMMDKAGVDKSLVYGTPNETVANMIKDHRDRFIPFANFDVKDMKAQVGELVYCVNSLGFKGVYEQVPATNYIRIDDFEHMDPLYKKAIDLDIPISWHLQDSFAFGLSRLSFSGNERLQEVCYKYPELKHILCHVGGAENFEKSLTAFTGYQNVYTELSTISYFNLKRFMTPWSDSRPWEHLSYLYPDLVTKHPSDMKSVMETVKIESRKQFREAANFMRDRLMLGTDSPLAGNVGVEVEICKLAFGHDETLMNNVMGETARKLLNL
jgi:hypothetical protein